MRSSQPNTHKSAAKEIKEKIAAIHKLDLREQSVDDLVPLMRELLAGHSLRCLDFDAGLLLYRGTPCEKLPHRFADVSYAPAERVKNDQRANRAGVPMFYCSATWHPPFFEAGVKKGDQIIISRWQAREPLRIAGFSHADLCADDPHSDREKVLRKALKQLPEPERLMTEFMTGCFTQPIKPGEEHRYRLSIALTEALGLGEKFDGLLYPSAAMNSPSHNLALHPHCIDEQKLVLQYVEHVSVNRVETETIDVCSLNFARGVAPGEKLHWLNKPGNWVLREGAQANDYCL
ncbi:RES domain-containing protein [Hymenobacter radiodurans]|uniref:RES domain-containing protein n=1 Tax=Hymenobacter radiodurans TaxID=2496028 RepID=UPI0010589060|nr:RES domain-containing protein [Hymenobacter radiodurans]